MTAKRVTQQPIPVAVVKHFRHARSPVARCEHCGWEQVEASLAEMRIHVRHHPAHSVVRLAVETLAVWAETRDGQVMTEDRHG